MYVIILIKEYEVTTRGIYEKRGNTVLLYEIVKQKVFFYATFLVCCVIWEKFYAS